MDFSTIKKDYTILNNNHELVYLDSAATSLTPKVVVNAMMDYYEKYNAPVHRGIYNISSIASSRYETARDIIADFFGCKNTEIIFTKSTTASINNVTKSISHLINEDDEIIVTELEHHSNFIPWQVLAGEKKAKLKVVRANNKQILVKDIVNMVTPKTKVVSVHHISNVIGNEIDIHHLCEEVKKINKNIIILIDGAQAAPHKEVKFTEIKCDFYTISAHKMYGPTGLGVLYINKRMHDIMKPFEYGGDMVSPSSVDIGTFIVKESPLKFEAGTPSVSEVIGFARAIEYIKKIGISNIDNYLIELKKYFVSKFPEIKDICTVYNLENNSNLITFNINGVSVHDAVSESPITDITFDKYNIALRDGQMCNNLTMKYVLNTNAVLRASLGIYNTKADIDKLIYAIKEIYKVWN